MVDKVIAQRDVEYFTELLAKETDENRRTVLLRLLADAENLRRAGQEDDKKTTRENTAEANSKGD